IWMDTGQRVVYKVRFNGKDNPASNYVDVGLDYKGGDNFPFFIRAKSDTGGDNTTYDFGATVNTKTAKIDFKADVKATGTDAGTFTADFNLQPSTSTINIEKPAGAKPIDQVLSDLGFGSTSDSSAASSPSAAADSSAGAGAIQLRNLTGNQSKSGSSSVGNLLLRRLLGQ
ncbi:MAG TPA: hypothetical protein VN554_00415, partial [Verrucomicrobiae bacterium]|nr:hypothetical protein [Verrucomicrobiae bacterium]